MCLIEHPEPITARHSVKKPEATSITFFIWGSQGTTLDYPGS
jgi:hypothetical protein